MDPRHVLEAVTDELVVEIGAELLRYPSILGGEGPCGLALADRMRTLGYEVHLQEVVAGRYNVIGFVRGGGGGQNLLLNGHLDVPDPVPGWTRDPYGPVVEDGWLYGNGVTDMKGGVASQIAAGAALIRSGARLAGDLVVSAVMHHDVQGVGTKFLVQALDVPCQMGINGEPTDLAVQLAHGGACQFEVTVRGRPAHVSRWDEGIDAIRKATDLLARLDAKRLTFRPDPKLPYLPRLAVGKIEGGTAGSVTAESCTIRGDVRLVDGMTPTTILRDLQRVIAEARQRDPSLEAEVRTLASQRPFAVDENAPIVRIVKDAHREVIGRPAAVTTGLPAGAFITDSPDMARAGISTVVYGPTEWRMVPDERARVADLVTAARVYALSALRVCGTAA